MGEKLRGSWCGFKMHQDQLPLRVICRSIVCGMEVGNTKISGVAQ